jgi:hypothetical protein
VNRIAPVLCRSPARRLLGHQETAERRNGERFLDLGGIEIDERPARAIARIVDDRVRIAELAGDIGEQPLHGIGLRRIAGKYRGASLGRERAKVVDAARRERDLHAGARKTPRNRGR